MKTIELSKGKRVDLRKGATRFTVETAWAPKNRQSIDVDLICIQLDRGRRLSDILFYNTTYRDPETGLLSTDDRSVQYSGDSRGTESENMEFMEVDLTKVSPDTKSLLFVVNIYEAHKSGQSFGDCRSIEITLKEGSADVPRLVYRPDEDYGRSRYLELLEITRGATGWEVVPVGTGSINDLATNLGKYTNNINGNG